MDSLQLNYFVAVAENENFSKAAKQLCISQSALSQTIARLEKEVGYDLFVRKGRYIELSQSGKAFLGAINNMKYEMENVMRQMAEINGEKEQRVSLYMGCASMYLPDIVKHIRKNTSHISLYVNQMNHVDDKQCSDFQIVGYSSPLEDENSALLLKEKIMLVLPKGHHLAKKEKIFVSDLKNEEFVALNENWGLREMMDAGCHALNFYPNISIVVDNPSVMRSLLQYEQGISFIPEKTWRKEFTHEKFVLRQVEGIELNRYVYLKWKKEMYMTDSIKSCISSIKSFDWDCAV